MSDKIFKVESYGKTYTIFGEEIKFPDAAERHYDLFSFMWKAKGLAEEKFTAWYGKKPDIDDVLNGYRNFATKLLDSEVCKPLFNQLADCEIYDISKRSYYSLCLDLENCQRACGEIAARLEAIVQQQRGEEAARELRKETRGRWEGGGFGLGGAIKGAVTAGALNLAGGVGHSMVNVVGNSISALSAWGEAKSLYESAETRKTLLNGIFDDIVSIVHKHINLLNKHLGDYVVSDFSADKSEALFTNAKKLPDKRRELLLQAVRYSPWDHGVVSFIFINYDKERKSVLELAERFGVDLTRDKETALKKIYKSAPKETDEELRALKKKLHDFMAEYNVGSSETMDSLDKEQLERIFERGEKDTIPQCEELNKAVEAYEARDKIKAPFLKNILERKNEIWDADLKKLCEGYKEADEERCNELLSLIEAFDAPKERKASFIKSVKGRIDEIWSGQDVEIFKKIYLETNLEDKGAVKTAIGSISKKKRTTAADPYLEALEACSDNTEELKKARSFLRGDKGWKTLAIICSVAGVLLLFLNFWLALVSFAAAIFCICKYESKREALLKLTVKGAHLHPALLNNPKQASESELERFKAVKDEEKELEKLKKEKDNKSED